MTKMYEVYAKQQHGGKWQHGALYLIKLVRIAHWTAVIWP